VILSFLSQKGQTIPTVLELKVVQNKGYLKEVLTEGSEDDADN